MLAIVLALTDGQLSLNLRGVTAFHVAQLQDPVWPPRPGFWVDLRHGPQLLDGREQ